MTSAESLEYFNIYIELSGRDHCLTSVGNLSPALGARNQDA